MLIIFLYTPQTYCDQYDSNRLGGLGPGFYYECKSAGLSRWSCAGAPSPPLNRTLIAINMIVAFKYFTNAEVCQETAPATDPNIHLVSVLNFKGSCLLSPLAGYHTEMVWNIECQRWVLTEFTM
jgi:hypothetical protein